MSKIKMAKLGGKMVKKNVFFTSGLILLILGMVIWIVNFSFVKIKSAEAATGDFSETWTAEEIFGMYRIGPDGGTLHDNAWGGITGTRICSTSDAIPNASNIVSDSGQIIWAPSGSCSYNAKIGTTTGGIKDAYLEPDSQQMQVVQWTVSGHIEP